MLNHWLNRITLLILSFSVLLLTGCGSKPETDAPSSSTERLVNEAMDPSTRLSDTSPQDQVNCRDLNLLNSEDCVRCRADAKKTCVAVKTTVEGKTCFSCEETALLCAQLGLISELECEYKCTNCVEVQGNENGVKCFKCDMKLGGRDCPDNDYFRDCSHCKEGEICEETSLIIFYEERKTLPQTCYSCSPKQ